MKKILFLLIALLLLASCAGPGVSQEDLDKLLERLEDIASQLEALPADTGVIRGAKLFLGECISCHGGGPCGFEVTPSGGTAMIEATIRGGVPSMMPSFQGILTTQQINDLLEFLRTPEEEWQNIFESLMSPMEE